MKSEDFDGGELQEGQETIIREMKMEEKRKKGTNIYYDNNNKPVHEISNNVAF